MVADHHVEVRNFDEADPAGNQLAGDRLQRGIGIREVLEDHEEKKRIERGALDFVRCRCGIAGRNLEPGFSAITNGIIGELDPVGFDGQLVENGEELAATASDLDHLLPRQRKTINEVRELTAFRIAKNAGKSGCADDRAIVRHGFDCQLNKPASGALENVEIGAGVGREVIVLAVLGAPAAGAAIGASGQICQELCEMVDECRNVTVCDQWVTDPGTGGLTDSHGNYRGRSVEFLN